jgi:hypothetical protein
MSKSIFSSPRLLLGQLQEGRRRDLVLAARLRWALSAVRMKVRAGTPGISSGYWNDRNTPLAARSLGSSASRSSPFRLAEPW